MKNNHLTVVLLLLLSLTKPYWFDPRLLDKKKNSLAALWQGEDRHLEYYLQI
ncbi:MAG: hypothetical protein ABJG68_04535 [Crocinitomicaceae bacterium]